MNGHGSRMSRRSFAPSPEKQGHGTFSHMFPGLARRVNCTIGINQENNDLLDDLGQAMATEGGGNPANDSIIPAGYTYLGQFVDHDITFDPLSDFTQQNNPFRTTNFRTPCLELDSVYGRGPGVDPYLYAQNTGDPQADGIKLLLGRNAPFGTGGPHRADGTPGTPTDFDLPRNSQNVALIGDMRNDENLVVSQLHCAFLKFHNAVVDHLIASGFAGDLFSEARRTVVHHYQWMVVHDFLKRIAPPVLVDRVLQNGPRFFRARPFRMPADFAMGAYRFGHSLIREDYAVNDNFPNATLGEVFEFVRTPRLPVFSNWVVDFNRFFDTGSTLPLQLARKIDPNLAITLGNLPFVGGGGIMAHLAKRNLRRGQSFSLPSGQCIANRMGLSPLSNAELLTNTPQAERDVLEAANGRYLRKTPLWYYVLKEAQQRENGDRLGPVGARIVVETFIRILNEDDEAFVHSGFTPTLPSDVAGQFTMADLLRFAGVLVQP